MFSVLCGLVFVGCIIVLFAGDDLLPLFYTLFGCLEFVWLVSVVYLFVVYTCWC